MAKINADDAEILKTPDLQEVLAKQGATSLAASPEEFGKSLRKDIEKWARTVEAAGVKMNWSQRGGLADFVRRSSTSEGEGVIRPPWLKR